MTSESRQAGKLHYGPGDGWDISISPHRPLHWYSDQGCYWLTAATLDHFPHFRHDVRKRRWVTEFYRSADLWGLEPVGWTFMEHHYHAILRVERGRSLPRFCARLHGRTSTFVNQEDGVRGRQVWRQYWDRLLRSEGDFWCRINYIWWNPVRHGFCERPEEWPWTNLHALMADADEATRAALQRFPAPGSLPGEEWYYPGVP